VTAVVACLLGFAVIAGADGGSTKSGQDYHFEVLLDGSRIGHQTFEVSEREDQQVVRIRADFKVKILFVPVYTYRHDNVEIWKDGCLQSISADTDDNGVPFSVRGRSVDDDFEITTKSGSELLPGCVSSFAYWDRGFLERPKLLNSQTGEHVSVTVTELGEGPVSFGGRDVPARCYLLTAEKIRIKLWYSREDDWLALESLTSKGNTLRYVRTEAPPAITAAGGGS
jgi:hypothetical protein